MADIKNIPVTDYTMAYGDREHVLIDVREPDEYASGHLPGAVNRPLGDIEDWAGEFEGQESVVLVCQRGGRSMSAAQTLQSKGIAGDIVNLDGGTSDWMEAGQPVEK